MLCLSDPVRWHGIALSTPVTAWGGTLVGVSATDFSCGRHPHGTVRKKSNCVRFGASLSVRTDGRTGQTRLKFSS